MTTFQVFGSLQVCWPCWLRFVFIINSNWFTVVTMKDEIYLLSLREIRSEIAGKRRWQSAFYELSGAAADVETAPLSAVCLVLQSFAWSCCVELRVVWELLSLQSDVHCRSVERGLCPHPQGAQESQRGRSHGAGGGRQGQSGHPGGWHGRHVWHHLPRCRQVSGAACCLPNPATCSEWTLWNGLSRLFAWWVSQGLMQFLDYSSHTK